MKVGIEKSAMIRIRAGISYALTEAPQDCPTTRFIVELDGQVDVFGIAASAYQRSTGTRSLQNQECVDTPRRAPRSR
jgi:hypothetical protein